MSSEGFKNIGLQRVSESGIKTVLSGESLVFQSPPVELFRKGGPVFDNHLAQGSLPETSKQKPKFCCIAERVENRPPKLEPSSELR